MHLLQIIGLCAVGLLATLAQADEDNEVKRGLFPFMAFVYYSDKTIVDRTGVRLARGAVLIRPEWLISSSLEDGETALAFPKETLVARLGAIRIDSGFTINEDEDEQEREIIEIARPYNYSATEWWFADISLLKTLLPFNITPAVAPASIDFSPHVADKGCFILVYTAPNGNKSEDKILMQLSVDILPSTPEACGSNFINSTMICGTESDDFKKEASFCEGNSGSPLVCDKDVVGIQTYINDCKPPYLYQHLSSWDNLITCAVEEKCKEEQCSTICKVIYKDPVDIPSQRTILAEAKIYPESSNSSNETVLPTTLLQFLLPDGPKTISDNDLQSEVNNTETTTSTSSTSVYITEKEIDVSTEMEMSSSTTTFVHPEEEQETSSSSVSTLSIYNTETDTSQYTYKNEELVNKVEELKNLIDENVDPDNSPVKEEQHHKVRSAAPAKTRYTFCVKFAYLVLFYLHFSVIGNSF